MTAQIEAPFTIDNEAKASWAVNKILRVAEERARVKAQYEAIERDLKSEEERLREMFEPLLDAWLQANPPRKGKSVKLLHGTVGHRRITGGPRITDTWAFTEWAKAHAQDLLTVETVYRPDREKVYRHIEETGELFPGIEIRPDEERLYIKAKAVRDEDE